MQKPETVEIPAHMIQKGDMCWHEGQGWFYVSNGDGYVPPALHRDGRVPRHFVKVARDASQAQLWNDHQRDQAFKR